MKFETTKVSMGIN